jgi:hypothetical protein
MALQRDPAAHARVGGRPVPLGTGLGRRQDVPVLDLGLWVQPLAGLTADKEWLGRPADLADLRAVQARRAGGAGPHQTY